MRFEIHHFHHFPPGWPGSAENSPLLADIKRILTAMSAEMDRLTASVATIQSKDDAIIALVQGLAQQLRDNAGDPAAITALADQLDAESAKITDAVNANTPTP